MDRHLEVLTLTKYILKCSSYRLTHLPYVPSKNTNLVQKENTNIISSQEVFIFLHKISEANIVNEYAYSQINCCPSIFVSKTVFYTLRLKMNSKVKLEAVTYRNESKPTQIDFTVVRREVRNLYHLHSAVL